MSPEPESCWTAVANIVRERPYGPGGADVRYGSKHFAPGARVYIIDWYAGMCERIIVVGQHRKSKRLITLTISVKLVENLRAKVCYAPAVIEKIQQHYASTQLPRLTRELAETMCRALPHWQARSWRTEAPALGPHPAAPAGSWLARLWRALRF